MLDIKFIRANPEIVKNAAAVKGFKCPVDTVLELDKRVRELKTITQNKTAEKNKITAQIASAGPCERAPLVAESKKLGAEIDADEMILRAAEHELNDLLHHVPQIPCPNSPIGPDDTFNTIAKTVGAARTFDFNVRPHYEILDMNGWWMPEKTADICGSRAYTLMGEAAELDLAMHVYAVQKMIARGFTYIQVPAIVKPQMVFDAGHFPGNDLSIMDNDVYYLNVPDRALSGTGEIVINSLHRNEILSQDQLPILYAGYSPCFRKEAGAAGRDTRGLIRFHQFHKIEQFVFCEPKDSEKFHAMLLEILEEIMRDLELPYRTVNISTGDMGFNKVKQHDIEAWMPAQATYRELGSCSSIGEFQARRTNTRYRENGTNEVKFVATLNNTGLVLPRTLAAVIENHQNADGSVNIPRALQPLMGGRKVIPAKAGIHCK